MKHDRTMGHWWWPWKCRIQEKQQSIWHVLKKANKTWVVHEIHEFLDDEYQINKLRTDLCLRMYCEDWCSLRGWMDRKNSHQSFASLKNTKKSPARNYLTKTEQLECSVNLGLLRRKQKSFLFQICFPEFPKSINMTLYNKSGVMWNQLR